MRVSNSGIDRQVYDLIKNDLDATSTRGKVIANNMANINTANYKRFDVVFKSELNNSEDLKMKVTNSKHVTDEGSENGVKVTQDTSTSMRADGNNVDLDVEKSNQAANSLLYNALITCANNKLSATRSVITGGGR